MRPLQSPISSPNSMIPFSTSGTRALLDYTASRSALSTSSQMTISTSSSTALLVGQHGPSVIPVQLGRINGSPPPPPPFSSDSNSITPFSSSLESTASRPASSTSNQTTASFFSSTAPLVGQDGPSVIPVQLGRINSPSPPSPPFSNASNITPFSSSLDSRPASSISSQTTTYFSSSTAPLVQDGPSVRAVQLGRINSPSPPPPPFSSASTGQPQLPSLVQVPPPWSSSLEQTELNPPVKPPTGLCSTSTAPFDLESQVTSRQTQLRAPSINTVPWGTNIPQSSLAASYSAWRPNFKLSSTPVHSTHSASADHLKLSFPTYRGLQRNQVTQSEPASLPAISSAYQVGNTPPTSKATSPFIANVGNYVPALPTAASLSAYSRNQMQQPVSRPLLGASHRVIEDFNSLSIGSAPGSNSGIDIKALPRPLESDVEANSSAELYPMNCNSRYLRLTTYAMPNCQSLVSRWHLPLGAVICPLAESPDGEEVPVVNYPPTGIIRCKTCHIFVNPYVTFTDGGRKWHCNFCTNLNDVPAEYFACLDANGRRMDLAERPELTKGSVEYVAAYNCMDHPPKPPVYLFLIDVSTHAVRSGMLEIVTHTIRSCLDKLRGFHRAQIGFITFDSRVHFYNMKSSLTEPQMMVVSDLDDIFFPLPDGLLVNLSESKTVVDAFLNILPSMFTDYMDVESAFGPAVKAATMAMSPIGGKLLIFQNTLPSLGVGRLRLRYDDQHVYGTDKEHVLRLPEVPFYQDMAAELTKYQIVVDLYAFSDKYADIASLGTLSRYTGGQVYYYPNFLSGCHKEKLKFELSRDLTRQTAWEALMRIRCGRGMRFATVQGNLMFRETDLLSLPAVDCDKAYTAQLCLEGTLQNSEAAYFQVSLLYTSSFGERRIRVHTATVPMVADLGEMYRLADTGAIISLFSRLAIEKTLSQKLVEARNFIQQQIVRALREYQSLCSVQSRSGGRMLYPESLKYLPLYGLSLCKSTPLRGGYGDAQLDERCAEGNVMMALPVKRLLKLLYPSLSRIDDYLLKASPTVDDFNKTCKRLPLSVESLDTSGLYIYDDGFRFVILFGRMPLPDVFTNLLGEGVATDFSEVSLCEHDNIMSRKLISMLEKLREYNPSCYQLPHVVRQGEHPGESKFLLGILIEEPVGGLIGYADWILKIYQQIQQNF